MLVDLQSPPYKLLSASATTISRNHCQLLPPHQKYNERGHGSIEKCSAYLSRGNEKHRDFQSQIGWGRIDENYHLSFSSSFRGL